MTDEDFEELFRVTMLDGLSENIAALGKHARECRAALRMVPMDHDPPCDDRRLDAQGDPGHWICTCHVAEARRVLGRDGGEGA